MKMKQQPRGLLIKQAQVNLVLAANHVLSEKLTLLGGVERQLADSRKKSNMGKRIGQRELLNKAG